MLLQNRITIVHGGRGAVGSAVAATLEDVAHSIRDEGGIAHVAVLDAVDRDAVERHAAAVADQSGGIDVCFNATFNDDIQGTPLVDMRVGDVMQPVAKAVTTSFTGGHGRCAPHGGTRQRRHPRHGYCRRAPRNRTSPTRTPPVCCCRGARATPMSPTRPSSPRPTGPLR